MSRNARKRADWEIGACIEELDPERKPWGGGQGQAVFGGVQKSRKNRGMH